MSAPLETFDLAPLLEEDAYITDVNEARIREAGILIACTLQRPSGQTFTAPLQCRRRPNRRPCRAWMEVRRSDVPPALEWTCSGCGAAGRVVGWQGTWIEDAPVEEGPPLHTARLPYTTFALLLDLAQDDEGLQAVTFSAEPRGDAEVEITLRRAIGTGAEVVLRTELLVARGPTETKRIEALLGALLPKDRPDLANDPAEVQAIIDGAMREALTYPAFGAFWPFVE